MKEESPGHQKSCSRSGAESSCVSSSGGVMYGMDDGLLFVQGNVHTCGL